MQLPPDLTRTFDAVRRDPADPAALCELAALALRAGHRSAARIAYEQAMRCAPRNTAVRVGFGNLLLEQRDHAAALRHFAAAAAVQPGLPSAHQGLARCLAAQGHDAAAEPHWRRGFAGHAIAAQRYRGPGTGIPLLLLVSVWDGNVATRRLIDDTVFAVTALYAEYYDPAQDLPPHALVFNAIGDADLCGPALHAARAIAARTQAPVVNSPQAVMLTGRAGNAVRLGAIPGVVAPAVRTVSRAEPPAGLTFPLLLRAPGFHTGQHFVRVERAEDYTAAAASLPGAQLLAIAYHDARAADGMARKYRAMIVGGVLFPLHLAVSAGWKVHYFTSEMDRDPAFREEERRFLDDMPSVLGPAAMMALGGIANTLGLDYGGIDFTLGRDGSVLVFEANATMVVDLPGEEAMWDYRRAPTRRVLAAVDSMLRNLQGSDLIPAFSRRAEKEAVG